MVFVGGFCVCFFGVGFSFELDKIFELEEVDGDRVVFFILVGLVFGIGVDVLGGCSVRFYLVVVGFGSGCYCVRIF